MAAVADASTYLTHSTSNSLILLGAEAAYPETDYGWIQPGPVLVTAGRSTIRHIDGFVEKPTVERAGVLRENGGLWNTMVMVARAASLWAIIRDVAPDLAAHFFKLQCVIDTCRERVRAEQTLPNTVPCGTFPPQFSCTALNACASFRSRTSSGVTGEEEKALLRP